MPKAYEPPAPPPPPPDPRRARIHLLVDQLLDALWSTPAEAVGLVDRTQPADPSDFEALTIREAAVICRVDPSVLYALAAKRQLPAVKVGRQWRILRGVLMRWIADGATPEKSPRTGKARASAIREQLLRTVRGR